ARSDGDTRHRPEDGGATTPALPGLVTTGTQSVRDIRWSRHGGRHRRQNRRKNQGSTFLIGAIRVNLRPTLQTKEDNMRKIKRREFIRNTTAAGIAIAATKNDVSGFPMILQQSSVKPMVISSANGNRFKNGGTVTAVQKAFTMITGGSDVLDD